MTYIAQKNKYGGKVGRAGQRNCIERAGPFTGSEGWLWAGWLTLHGEVQGIMSNGHIGLPLVNRQNDRQTNTTVNITFATPLAGDINSWIFDNCSVHGPISSTVD